MLEYSCSAWPDSGHFGYKCSACGRNGKRVIRNPYNVTLLHSPLYWENCKSLCLKERIKELENGCCGIDEFGCHWKAGSQVIKGNFSGVAVACKGGKQLYLLCDSFVHGYI